HDLICPVWKTGFFSLIRTLAAIAKNRQTMGYPADLLGYSVFVTRTICGGGYRFACRRDIETTGTGLAKSHGRAAQVDGFLSA
ncbi:hypothetical protein V7O33_24040, partial [Escherichia coli]|uniref:hypothetical protein n=1 Tax=Escherichia coli TaxID=562 RepID=UPI00398C8EA7